MPKSLINFSFGMSDLHDLNATDGRLMIRDSLKQLSSLLSHRKLTYRDNTYIILFFYIYISFELLKKKRLRNKSALHLFLWRNNNIIKD